MNRPITRIYGCCFTQIVYGAKTVRKDGNYVSTCELSAGRVELKGKFTDSKQTALCVLKDEEILLSKTHLFEKS